MPRIFLEFYVGYFSGYLVLKKEVNFIPIPGMTIKFPEKSFLGEIFVCDDPGLLPDWDIEKNKIRVHIKELGTEDLEVFKKWVRALKDEGWEITENSQINEDELSGI
jgi:hypothetical protein